MKNNQKKRVMLASFLSTCMFSNFNLIYASENQLVDSDKIGAADVASENNSRDDNINNGVSNIAKEELKESTPATQDYASKILAGESEVESNSRNKKNKKNKRSDLLDSAVLFLSGLLTGTTATCLYNTFFGGKEKIVEKTGPVILKSIKNTKFSNLTSDKAVGFSLKSGSNQLFDARGARYIDGTKLLSIDDTVFAPGNLVLDSVNDLDHGYAFEDYDDNSFSYLVENFDDLPGHLNISGSYRLENIKKLFEVLAQELAGRLREKGLPISYATSESVEEIYRNIVKQLRVRLPKNDLKFKFDKDKNDIYMNFSKDFKVVITNKYKVFSETLEDICTDIGDVKPANVKVNESGDAEEGGEDNEVGDE